MSATRAPWHPGEVAMQTRVGVAARMDEVGRRVVRDYMPDQHREFFAQLPFVVLGSVAPDGRVWATLRAGAPGFLRSPDPRVLDIAIVRDASDPADAGFEDGDAIGLLGIDLATRRRNRMNGVLRFDGAARAHIDVGHSFGNCPRYIHERILTPVDDGVGGAGGSHTSTSVQRLEALDERARALIASASALFVASYADLDGEPRQVDVSHRGGKPGFVRLDADGGLTVPDFNGNLFFNTLGNFTLNPVAGVTFADFSTGELLQMYGRAEVIIDSPEIAAFQGAERLWRFFPEQIVRRERALPLRWVTRTDGEAPSSLMTGDWNEAADRLRAASVADQWRPFRVTRIVDESSVVRSFYLAPADDAGRIPHQAGQHLPIRVTLPGHDAPVMRTYTLSVAPSDAEYRISVKREGEVSRHLHDHVQVGDVIETRAPAGAFTIDPSVRRPAVLLAAGIGVTPMLAMLRHMIYEGARKQRMRPTWFFHSARSLAERAFSAELDALALRGNGAVEIVRLLSDPSGAMIGRDYDESGRVTIDVLRAHLPFDDYDFYLCGPAAFMQSLYDGLRTLNVPNDRIHAEAFGTSSIVRDDAPVLAPVATDSVPVIFTESVKEARWNPGAGSLLELAEDRGLSPPFSCRAGSCGSCRTHVLQGEVTYAQQPEFPVPEGEALICCAMPAANSQPIHLAL